MTFKQDYLQNKAANWKNHDRNLLAEREYKTISYLLKVHNLTTVVYVTPTMVIVIPIFLAVQIP